MKPVAPVTSVVVTTVEHACNQAAVLTGRAPAQTRRSTTEPPSRRITPRGNSRATPARVL